MIPQTGQHVKCVLRNGAIAEGIVEEWFNNHVQLKSLDGQSILIIAHPAEDIMLIKILLEQTPEKPKEEKSELEEIFDAAVEAHDPTNADDRKSLAELKVELAKQERQIIAEKLKEHRPSVSAYKPSTTPYHYPSVVTKTPSPYQPRRNPNGPSRPSKK